MNRRKLMIALSASATLAGCNPFSTETKAPTEGRKHRKKDEGRAEERGEGRPQPAPTVDSESPKAEEGRHLERIAETYEGFERTSFRYMPKDVSGPVPLVLICHGNGGDAAVMFRQNGLLDVVRRMGWAAIFPNTGRKDVEQGDESYLSHLIQSATEQMNVDREQVFGIGFSGGGKSTYRLAARRKFFKAIAVHSCRVGHRETPELWNPDQCESGKVSILHIHGKADSATPWEGGVHENHPDLFGVPFAEGLELWANHNGCTAVKSATLADAPPRAIIHDWQGPGNLRVTGVLDPELKHQWGKYSNRLIANFLKSQVSA